MVDFSGWEMPIHYGSQIDEHHLVRSDVGMFDVSHMTVVDLKGPQTKAFLRFLLANDVERLHTPGKALYSCMLNEQGGVIDDLIVYFMLPDWYRMVVNAATREKDLAWIQRQASKFKLTVTERPELAMIAVQGPKSAEKLAQCLDSASAVALRSLTAFSAVESHGYFLARTGYTGEEGFEVILDAAAAVKLWQGLRATGVAPIGLGARDTLRLEAGMNLYGSDMDETTTPLESGLAWTVAWEPLARDFIGRSALMAQREQSPARKLIGLVLEDKGVLRNHQKVIVAGVGEGEITSGSFSPTLGLSIAFARVPKEIGTSCGVEIRGKLATARVVKAPFVRYGKSCIHFIEDRT